MHLNLNWINILILFGAVQGLIFSVILLFNKKHPGAKFLSIFMFVFAYNGFETFNWSAGLDKYYIFLHLYPFVVIYAVGPTLYLYVRSLLYPDQRVPRKSIMAHFAIVGFQFTFRSIEIVYHLLWVNDIYRGAITNQQVERIYWTYSEPLSIAVFIIYLIATIRTFRMAKTAGVTNLGHSKEARVVTFKWIKALIGCMVVMGFAWPLTVIASYFTDVPDTAYYPIEVVLVLFIYWIAYAGYQKVILIYINQKVKSNGLARGESEAFFGKLRQAMENEKLYLDPELNLNKVASHTGLSPKAISATLNQFHQTNFNDFINQYRIGEVKQKLVEPGHEHLTISGIAFETGFNSQATFQRAFKNSTGMSPREYINLHRNELTRQ